MDVYAAGRYRASHGGELNPHVSIVEIGARVGIGNKLRPHRGEPEIAPGHAADSEVDRPASLDLEFDCLVGSKPFGDADEGQSGAGLIRKFGNVGLIPDTV